MSVDYYSWKCKGCGRPINRGEECTLIAVKDGKETGRVTGNYNQMGGVDEQYNEPADKRFNAPARSTAAWHTKCYNDAKTAPKPDKNGKSKEWIKQDNFKPSEEDIGRGGQPAVQTFVSVAGKRAAAHTLLDRAFDLSTPSSKRAAMKEVAKLVGVSFITRKKPATTEAETETKAEPKPVEAKK